MKTKVIIFSDGIKKEMNFEQVRERFMPTIKQMIKRTNMKSLYNQVEVEDFRQELEIELWRAFDQYDPSMGVCFSTYLHPKLLKGVRNVTYSRYSLKNQHSGLISMNAPMGDDELKLEDTFATSEDTLSDLSYLELVKLIQDSIDEDEEDVLKCLLDKKEFSVQNYADKYGISRQAANARIIKLKKKLQVIIKEQYLFI